jgi:hypothetical protein
MSSKAQFMFAALGLAGVAAVALTLAKKSDAKAAPVPNGSAPSGAPSGAPNTYPTTVSPTVPTGLGPLPATSVPGTQDKWTQPPMLPPWIPSDLARDFAICWNSWGMQNMFCDPQTVSTAIAGVVARYGDLVPESDVRQVNDAIFQLFERWATPRA